MDVVDKWTKENQSKLKSNASCDNKLKDAKCEEEMCREQKGAVNCPPFVI